MSTPSCFTCGRWNDPSGGPEAHSGGCPETGKPYPGAVFDAVNERVQRDLDAASFDAAARAAGRASARMDAGDVKGSHDAFEEAQRHADRIKDTARSEVAQDRLSDLWGDLAEQAAQVRFEERLEQAERGRAAHSPQRSSRLHVTTA